MLIATTVQPAVAYFGERRLDVTGLTNAVLVVASQEYLDAPGAGRTVPQWVLDGFTSAGWHAAGAAAAEIAVEFVDGRGRAADGTDYPQIEGIRATKDLPVAAAVRVPVNVLRFSRGSISCSAEIADVSAPLARAWASQVTQPTAMRRIRDAGLGQVDEKCAVMTAGDLLVRTDVWEEGVVGGSLRNAPRSRALAGEILDALGAAHGA